jgi:hypothetical protein
MHERALNEQAIFNEIENFLLEVGHHHTAGCVICITADMIKRRFGELFMGHVSSGDIRIIDDVRITGPKS